VEKRAQWSPAGSTTKGRALKLAESHCIDNFFGSPIDLTVKQANKQAGKQEIESTKARNLHFLRVRISAKQNIKKRKNGANGET